jgi:ABC-type branched-subunit amino acid transport system substrate-binding protein
MKKFFRYLFLGALLLTCTCISAQTTKWRDMHQVQKHETLFGIAKDYGISIQDIIDANPEMKVPGYELKKGEYIFIPYSKAQRDSVKTSVAVVPPVSKAGVDMSKRAINVEVMLPLHDENGDGRRMVEYYRGLLMACEKLKKDGISVNLSAWNVPIDTDIRMTLLEKGVNNCDIIFGPLYSNMVKPLADFAVKNGTKIVVPFSISGNDVMTCPNIFQVYQSPTDVNAMTISHFVEHFPNCHPIFVDCNDAQSDKGSFTLALRKQLEKKGILFSITNLSSTDASFAMAFSRTQNNVIILNTGRSPELNTTLAKLDILTKAYPGVKVSLFGYTEWLMYTKVYQNYFFKYDAYIPTSFYYNAASSETRQFEAEYANWFKSEMMDALPRFAITGYDQGCYFLTGLHKFGKAFEGSKSQSAYKPLQSPLHFTKVGKNGGMQNTNFMFVHYLNNHTIESINY